MGVYVDLPYKFKKGAAVGVPAVASLGGHRVYSDIDDTLVCTGRGKVDCAAQGIKRNKVFPGVIAFQLALARGIANSAEVPSAVPITARPHIFKLFSGLKNSVSAVMGVAKTVHKAYAAYNFSLNADRARYGTLLNLLENVAVLGHKGHDATDYDRTAYLKFKGFQQDYADHIAGGKSGVVDSYFVGDNWAASLITAQMMLSYRPHRGQGMRAAFIFDTLHACDDNCVSRWREYGIFMFRDYASAARIARDQELISEAGFKSVCDATKRESAGKVVC